MADETSTTDPPPPSLLPNLPDDVALQCIARVPRSQYPSLSLVSKSWLSTVRSPPLYTTRLFLNCTQHFLYLNLRVNSSFTWYFLDQNPRTRYPLPPCPSQTIGSSFAVLGPKIYVIGGSMNGIPLNSVWVFDCRFNKWEIGPEMGVGREFSVAGAVNGKIYVMGGCTVDSPWAEALDPVTGSWVEALDPVTGSWAAVASPIEVWDKWVLGSVVINDKIYVLADPGGVVYDVVTGEWGDLSTGMDAGWRGRGAVVDGVFYCYDDSGTVRGYDVEEDEWKELKGVEKSLPKFVHGAAMANLGGRLFVVWVVKGSAKENEVMCAAVEIQKDGRGWLSGSVVWSDAIFVVPKRSGFYDCLTVGL